MTNYDDEREAAWGEFRDGPNYQPTDRYDARSVWDAAWDAARKHPEPEITDEAALQEDREALATLLDEVHDDCVTEGGCEFVGWQRGWRPFDQSEPSRHVDVIIASPVWQNRHRVPVGEEKDR